MAAVNASAVRLSVPAGIRGSLRAPASKSYTNRALVLAALAEGASRILEPLESDDTLRMKECLRAMGVAIHEKDGAWLVTGTAGRPASPAAMLDAGLSGTTLRFLAAVLTLAPSGGTIGGREGLLRRPVGALTAALRLLGAEVEDRAGLPPVTVRRGGLRGGAVTVDARASSQFATAVLMVAPCAELPTTVKIEHLSNPGYVAMTLDSMRLWGADFRAGADGAISFPGAGGYKGRDGAIEYDASAAMHLFALAVGSGGSVTVENASAGTKQPDARLLDVFEAMGARVSRQGDRVTVRGTERPVACSLDLGAMPDQVPTVAVLAALCEGTTQISNVAMVRGHETDRLAALAVELRKVGAEVDELPDGLRIRGPGQPRPASIATYGDHRMAMAFAALAARVPGIEIQDPACVSKTYPGFWEDAQRLGVGVLPA